MQMTTISMKLHSIDDLFDPFDPSPPQSRRLSDGAVSYLVASLKHSKEPNPVKIALLTSQQTSQATNGALCNAILEHFRRQADTASDEIRRIRRLGRIFIPIGFIIMAVCFFASELLTASHEQRLKSSIGEGILVLGWVALWAPFDHLLFGRIPMFRERDCYLRLSQAEVHVQYTPEPMESPV